MNLQVCKRCCEDAWEDSRPFDVIDEENACCLWMDNPYGEDLTQEYLDRRFDNYIPEDCYHHFEHLILCQNQSQKKSWWQKLKERFGYESSI